ncbi:signal peptidase II [Pelagibacterium montanilacus]|uniref:signal peptidase II n=1 Tax=Pelagibacterium montanilacus TaxID=2185280 RepID=UPI000F8D21E2|nr:signal peptidase II [Pelagibacterium montanilacus]
MTDWRSPSVIWSLFLGLDVLILDRLHKFVQIDVMGWTGGEVVPVTPFFDYVLVWNTGISYGLLGGLSPEMLLVIMALAMVALGYWWWKDTALLTRLGIALALGGAFSNAIDRVIYGAVADFFHFYAMGWSFYIFNIADVAITLGVILLIFDAFRPRRDAGKQP